MCSILGLDRGKCKSVACLFHINTGEVRFRTVSTTPHGLRANRQIIVEILPPDHRGASRSSDRHYIVEIGGGTGAIPCRSVPDPATDRV
jgi:hypothetical protein